MHLPDEFDGLDEVLNKSKYRYSVEDYKMLCKHSKYAPRLVAILYHIHRSVSHKELIFMLGLKPKHFNNFMRKLVPFGIIFDEYYVEGRFYSLSPKGYEFYQYLENNNLLEVK